MIDRESADPKKVQARSARQQNQVERRRTIELLPAQYNDSGVLPRFFSTVVDQLYQPEASERLSGFIGRRPDFFDEETEFYIDEPTPERQFYQLEPTMVSQNQETGEISNVLFYQDLINNIRFHGGIVSNQDRLFNSLTYTWAPPIDIDKILNFTLYFWLPGGPDLLIFEETSNVGTFIGSSGDVVVEGVTLNNGDRVLFENDINVFYRDRIFEVEGVGTSFNLRPVSVDTFPWDDPILGWDNGFWDGNNPQERLVRNTPDYIVMQRGARDNNQWSAGNNWYHIDDLNPDQIERASTNRANRPIIEFRKDLELYQYGNFGRDAVTVRDDLTTSPSSEIAGQIGPIVIDGITLVDGDTILFTNAQDLEGTYDLSPWDMEDGTNGSWDQFFSSAASYSSNFGSAVFTNSPNGAITDITADFVLSGFEPGQEISITGSNGSNDGNYIVQSVTQTSITLTSAFTDTGNLGTQLGNVTIIEERTTFLNRVFTVTNLATGAVLTPVINGQSPVGAPVDGEQIPVQFGLIHGNNEYFFSDADDGWILSQQKNTVNQPPLFQLYDSLGNSLDDPEVYPNSNFSGNKIFSFAENIDGQNPDTVLGINLQFDNFGQILFENNLVTDRYNFGFNNSQINGYYFHRTIGANLAEDLFSNDWYVKSDQSRQRIVQQFETDDENRDFVLAATPTSIDDIEIVLDQQVSNETFVLDENIVKFVNFFENEQTLEIKYLSDETPSDRYEHFYEVPVNLEANPDNLEVNFVSRTDFFDHFSNIIENQASFIGSPNGNNNYRQTTRNLGLGTEIRQHQAPLLRTMLISGGNERISLMTAIRYVEREYSRFRNKFIRTITDFFNNNTVVQAAGVDAWIEEAFNRINLGKNTQSAFRYTGMGFRDDGSPTFIPASPVRLGIYPASLPQMLTISGTNFIRFHDGSERAAFGDFRDEVILGLEQRIFDNLPEAYKDLEVRPDFDYADFVSTADFEADYSIQEFNLLLTPILQRWAAFQGFNLNENTIYDPDDPFTWNYSKQGIPGYWRGIYKLYYGTDRPNTHPWEIFDFTEKPSWWESRYGVGPYTSDSNILWDDVRVGRIPFGPRSGVYPQYARSAPVPVDQDGILKDPIRLGLATTPNSKDARASWEVGDHGPVETAFRKSEYWPFAIAQVSFLMKPAQFVEIGWCPNDSEFRYVNDPNPQWVSIATGDRPRLRELQVHGETDIDGNVIINDGIQQWISDRLTNLGLSITENFGDPVRNLVPKLGHKVAGFINSDATRLVADNFGLVPAENFDTLLYRSPSIREEFYGGIIIERVERGWAVFGYDVLNPVFNILPGLRTGRRTAITVGSYRVEEKLDISTQVEQVSYGTTFSSIQDLYDFIIGWGNYLESQGWIFDQIDGENNTVNNWRDAGKHYLFWAQGNWSKGSLLTLSPASKQVKFATEQGATGGLEEVVNGVYSLLDRDGRVIQPEDTSVTRFENETTIIPAEDLSIFSARLFVREFEHVILFDNETIFNDVIYSPLLNLRQSRFKLFATRAGDWRGRVDAPGYIVTNNQIRPNFEKTVDDFRRYFEIENVVDTQEIQEAAQNLVAFRERDYFTDLGFSLDSQFQFHQGLIREKGTAQIIDSLLRARLNFSDTNFRIFEEWAFRLGDFGGVNQSQTVEVLLRENEWRQDPQLIETRTTVLETLIANDQTVPFTITVRNLTNNFEEFLTTGGIIQINQEKMSYSSAVLNDSDPLDRNPGTTTLTISERGILGTTPATHAVGSGVSIADTLFDDVITLVPTDERWVRRPADNGQLAFNTRSGTGFVKRKNGTYLRKTDFPVGGYVLENEVTYRVQTIAERDALFNQLRATVESRDLQFNDMIWVDNIGYHYLPKIISGIIEDDGNGMAVLNDSVDDQLESVLNADNIDNVKITSNGVGLRPGTDYSIDNLGNGFGDINIFPTKPDPNNPLSQVDIQIGEEIVVTISNPRRIWNNEFQVYKYTNTGLTYSIPTIPGNPGDPLLVITNTDHNFVNDQTVILAGITDTNPDINSDYTVQLITELLGSTFVSASIGDSFSINGETISISADTSSIDGLIGEINDKSIPGVVAVNRSNSIALYNTLGGNIEVQEITDLRTPLSKIGFPESPNTLSVAVYSFAWPVDPDTLPSDAIDTSVMTTLGESFIVNNGVASSNPSDADRSDNIEILVDSIAVPFGIDDGGTPLIPDDDIELSPNPYFIDIDLFIAEMNGLDGIIAFRDGAQVYIIGENGNPIHLSNNNGTPLGDIGFDQSNANLTDAPFTLGINGAILSPTQGLSEFSGNLDVGEQITVNGVPLVFSGIEEINNVASLINTGIPDTLALVRDNFIYLINPNNTNTFTLSNDTTALSTIGLANAVVNESLNAFSVNAPLTSNPHGTGAIPGATIGIFTELRFRGRVHLATDNPNYVAKYDNPAIESNNVLFRDFYEAPIGSQWDNTFSGATELPVLSFVDNGLEPSIDFPLPRWAVYRRHATTLPFIPNGETTTGVDWEIHTQDDNTLRIQNERIDVDGFERSLLYNRDSQLTDVRFGLFDPAKGIFPGDATKEVSFKIEFDPAKYTHGDATISEVDQEQSWGEERLGEVWWDLSEVEYENYEIGSNRQRRNKWGRLAPGKSIAVYEWVRSPVPPSEWADFVAENEDQPESSFSYKPSGEAFLAETGNPPYSQRITVNPTTNQQQVSFFFWVRNSETLINLSGRDLSVAQIARQLTDPRAQGIPYVAPVNRNAFIISGVQSFLTMNDTVAQINYNRILTENIRHREWLLMREDDSNSVPDDLFWDKMQQSLAGFMPISDTSDLTPNFLQVPDPNLEDSRKYGNLRRPRQSWFIDSDQATRIFVNKLNELFSQSCIIDERPDAITNLSVSSDLPTEYNGPLPHPDGRARNAVEYDYEVSSILARNNLVVERNLNLFDQAYVLATEDTNGFWKVYQWQGNWVRGTVDATFNAGDSIVINGQPVILNGTTIDDAVSSINSSISPTLAIAINDDGALFIYQPDGELLTIAEGSGSALADLGITAVSLPSNPDRSWLEVGSETFKLDDFFSIVDFTQTNFDVDNAIPDITVQTLFDRNSLVDLTDGTLVEVLDSNSDGSNLRGLFEYQGIAQPLTPWLTQYKEQCTLEFNTDLFLDDSYGNDDTWTDPPFVRKGRKDAIYALVDVLRSTVATDLEENLLFFTMVRYVHDEQVLVDWVFKTSFLSALGLNQVAEQLPIFNSRQRDSIIDFINEIKPYHTKLRDFRSQEDAGIDVYNANVTDFDKPVGFDNTSGEFRVLDPTSPTDVALMSNPDSDQFDWLQNYQSNPDLVRSFSSTIVFDRVSCAIGFGWDPADGFDAGLNTWDITQGEIPVTAVERIVQSYSPQPFNDADIEARRFDVEDVITSLMPGCAFRGTILDNVRFEDLEYNSMVGWSTPVAFWHSNPWSTAFAGANLVDISDYDTLVDGGQFDQDPPNTLAEIIIDGDMFAQPNFDSGHPEELALASAGEALSICVETQGFAGTPEVISRAFSLNSPGPFEIGQKPAHAGSLFLYLNGELVDPDNYTVDWNNDTVTLNGTFFTTVNQGQDRLSIVSTNQSGGEAVLLQRPIDGDGTVGPYSLGDTVMDENALVVVKNGVILVNGVDYILVNSNTEIQFAVPVLINDDVQQTVFAGPNFTKIRTNIVDISAPINTASNTISIGQDLSENVFNEISSLAVYLNGALQIPFDAADPLKAFDYTTDINADTITFATQVRGSSSPTPSIGQTITINGTPVTYTRTTIDGVADDINDANITDVSAFVGSNGELVINQSAGQTLTISGSGLASVGLSAGSYVSKLMDGDNVTISSFTMDAATITFTYNGGPKIFPARMSIVIEEQVEVLVNGTVLNPTFEYSVDIQNDVIEVFQALSAGDQITIKSSYVNVETFDNLDNRNLIQGNGDVELTLTAPPLIRDNVIVFVNGDRVPEVLYSITDCCVVVSNLVKTFNNQDKIVVVNLASRPNRPPISFRLFIDNVNNKKSQDIVPIASTDLLADIDDDDVILPVRSVTFFPGSGILMLITGIGGTGGSAEFTQVEFATFGPNVYQSNTSSVILDNGGPGGVGRLTDNNVDFNDFRFEVGQIVRLENTTTIDGISNNDIEFEIQTVQANQLTFTTAFTSERVGGTPDELIGLQANKIRVIRPNELYQATGINRETNTVNIISRGYNHTDPIPHGQFSRVIVLDPEAAEFAFAEAFRISDDRKTVLTQDLRLDDTEIHIEQVAGLPKQGTNEQRMSTPGVIWIGGERIEFLRRDGTVLKEIRRGTKGTAGGVPFVYDVGGNLLTDFTNSTLVYPSGTEVVNGSRNQLFGDGYRYSPTPFGGQFTRNNFYQFLLERPGTCPQFPEVSGGALSVDPFWITPGGSIGTVSDMIGTASFQVEAAFPPGVNLTPEYEIIAGSLPPSLVLDTLTGEISGTVDPVVADETSTFTVRAFASGREVIREFSITIEQCRIEFTVDQNNVDLAQELQDQNLWDGIQILDCIVTIASGVTIGSSSTSMPAFDIGTVPVGSTVSIINEGTIQGAGGAGGAGAIGGADNSIGDDGQPGGPALNITCDVNINNTNGNIWGGGGGGAGGGAGKTREV